MKFVLKLVQIREMQMHTPVLSKEVIEILQPKKGDFFIDGTLGEGGHAASIIERILPEGSFLALDLDIESLNITKKIIEAKFQIPNDKFQIFWINDNFMNIPKILKNKKLGKADGVLLDLGFSSRQLEAGRGFSFQKDEPLLMTYRKDAAPLKEILSRLSEKEILEIIKNYGEERFAGRIARAIFERERIKPIETSGELADIVKAAVPKNYEKGRIHPATRTFLAFRIYINQELDNLEKFLDSVETVIAPGGRIGIISFNSLEDRIVKNMFRLMAKRNILRVLTKKPIRATAEEIALNPRSRSAKLRAAIMNVN